MPRNVPLRIVLTADGVRRKFFSLFEGKDGSIYIHPNRSGPWRVPGLEQNEKDLVIDWRNPIEHDFDLHKISFHPSGYVHLTDQNGNRFRDGTKGPSFEEMEDVYLFCMIFPPRLDELPTYKGDRKCACLDFVLPDNVTPFVLTIALLKGEIGQEAPDPARLMGRIIQPLQCGYKLTFILRTIEQHGEEHHVDWPNYPFFLLRTGA